MHLQSCSKQHLTMEVATDIAVADIIDPVCGVFVCDSFLFRRLHLRRLHLSSVHYR